MSSNNTRGSQSLLIIGILLIAVGLWRLASEIVPGAVWASGVVLVRSVWRIAWPILLLGLGAYLLWAARTGKLDKVATWSAGREFRRSVTDKRLLGVCGGIAYYYGVDSAIVRVGFIVLLVALPFVSVVSYLLIALFVPAG